MSRDDITQMAREAGLTVCRDEWVFGAMLERSAELVRADEREACAKVADRYVGADPIADAIRARSNT